MLSVVRPSRPGGVPYECFCPFGNRQVFGRKTEGREGREGAYAFCGNSDPVPQNMGSVRQIQILRSRYIEWDKTYCTLTDCWWFGSLTPEVPMPRKPLVARPAPLAPRQKVWHAAPAPEPMGRVVWSSLDEQAANEAAAINGANRLRVRRPKGKHQV